MEQDSYQESETAFFQRAVPVVGVGLPTLLSFPVPVPTVTGTMKRYRRDGNERDEISNDSSDSSDDGSDDKDSSNDGTSCTDAERENIDGENND